MFTARKGVVVMEAEHCFESIDALTAKWVVIPYMGRTLSGIALMPYSQSVQGASLSYKMQIPKEVDSVTVRVVVKSTLAFHNAKGHEYTVGFKGGEKEKINFNSNLNEQKQNVYTVYYPTVARRVVEKQVKLQLPTTIDGMQTLTIKPLDPGIVFEKIVVDMGGYEESYLFMDESPNKRE